MDAVIDLLARVMGSMPQFALAFLLLLIAKVIYDRTTPYKFSDELTEKDNPAFGVCLAGYLIGTGIALCGALFGTGASLVDDVITVLVGGLLVVILMRVSVLINDKLILSSFDIDKEMIEDRNLGTGCVVAGGCIATGFMLNGALTGDSVATGTSFAAVLFTGMRDIIAYWVLGQIVLIIGAILFQKFTMYDVHQVIERDDNIPAGISFGGFLIALGIIVRASIAGAGSNILGQLVVVAVVAVVGLVLLACTRVIADRIFLPNSPLSKEVAKDKNPAAGAIAAASFICVAALLSAAITQTLEAKPTPAATQQESAEDPSDEGQPAE